MSDDVNLKIVGRIEDAVEKRKNEPFFVVLPRPQYPNCSHESRGVTLDSVKRTVYCKCGAQLDPFDALLIYSHAERRQVHTLEAIEQHKKDEADKKAALAERKPFLREVRGWSAVYNPKPPKGDGALVGFDVKLSCEHNIRWPSKGRRHPGRHLTCTICLESKRRESIKSVK